MTGEELEALILDAAKDLAAQGGAEIPSDLGPETALFGEEGIFDSLGLVTLIVIVEEAVQERCDTGISLADERALSQSRSPFRTIRTLAAYAHGLLKETGNEC